MFIYSNVDINVNINRRFPKSFCAAALTLTGRPAQSGLMSSENAPAKRRKRSAAEAREDVLAAARALLLKGGPSAVTLAAVGRAVGMSHGNVIHHFGSAAELQTALMGRMVQDLSAAIESAVGQIRTDEATPRLLTDIVFEAFDTGGAGYLAAWIILSNEDAQLEPVREALQDLVEAVYQALPDKDDGARARISKAVLLLALCAFGDSVIGPPLRDMLKANDEAGRELVADILTSFLTREPV